MADNQYHFVTRWRVRGTCGEVADVLNEPLGLPRWWPSVYLRVEEIAPADARGLGRRVRLLSKGWLPYTLRWEYSVVESNYPHGFALVASGDFAGRGVWTIEQDGEFVDVTFEWAVRADKPLLRTLSFLLRPVFESNHRWAMAQGEISLKLELERRRAASEAARAAVPAPPGPVTYAGVALAAGGAIVVAGALYVLARTVSKRSAARRQHPVVAPERRSSRLPKAQSPKPKAQSPRPRPLHNSR
jgi:hypothetical protein